MDINDINGVNGYLSRFEGTEVDDAVERVQQLNVELAQKVDKTTTINGFPLENNITLTAEDVGAMPFLSSYAKSIDWNDETYVLYLKDQDDRVLDSAFIGIDIATWGKIGGTLTAQTDLKDAFDSKQPMITSSAMLSSDLVDDTGHTHKFATAAQLTQIATNKSDIATNAGAITTINGKIPSQASSSNQLADKNFVNSSISTNTANFIGTFSSLAELEAYSGPLTNNDYAFVTTTDGAGNVVYNRYKYNSSTSEWVFEYALNNSSFTADQWAAINSGATTTNVEQITTNKNDISTINTTLGTFGNIVTYNAGDFATAAQGAKADTALQSINSSMVTAALGYTPYNSTNPNNYISSAAISTLTDVTLSSVTGGQYLVYDGTNQKWKNTTVPSLAWGNITGTLTNQTDLKTALDGKQATITGAATTITGNNLTASRVVISDSSGKIGTSSITTTKLGYLTDVTSNIQAQLDGKYSSSNPSGFISGIDSSMVTTALGYTPYNSTNPSGYISGITSSDVTTALGYTPYNATNPNNYISGINSTMVTTALGYTPYNSTNPNNYISSAALSTLTDVALTSPIQGQNLIYDATAGKWKNASITATVGWGGITGNINDQTDLKQALDSKASVTIRDWSS